MSVTDDPFFRFTYSRNLRLPGVFLGESHLSASRPIVLHYKAYELPGHRIIALVSNLLNRDRKQGVHMRIALSAWDGQISPVFDSADHVVLFDMKRGKVQSQINATLGSMFPTERVTKLKALGTDTLICGAVSSPLAEMLKCSGIEVISFVSGEVGTVLDAFLNGMLPSQELTMPGCWKGKGRRRKHRGVSAVRKEDLTKQLVDRTEGLGGIQVHE